MLMKSQHEKTIKDIIDTRQEITSARGEIVLAVRVILISWIFTLILTRF